MNMWEKEKETGKWHHYESPQEFTVEEEMENSDLSECGRNEMNIFKMKRKRRFVNDDEGGRNAANGKEIRRT